MATPHTNSPPSTAAVTTNTTTATTHPTTTMTATPTTTPKKKQLCRFPGCSNVIKSQGHCQRHGAKPKRCKVDGCDKQAQGTYQGMCKRHWWDLSSPGQQWQRFVDNTNVMDGAQWLRQCQLDVAEYQQNFDNQETRWMKQQEPQHAKQPPKQQQQWRSSFPLPRTTTQATVTMERKQREAKQPPPPQSPSSPPPLRPPTQINAIKHWNIQNIMARAAAAQTGATAAKELIRVEVEAEEEAGDVVWDQNTRCPASPWRQFRNGRQIMYYPPPELPLSPHRAAHLRLRMLQQEQHLFVPEELADSTSTSAKSVQTLLAAAVAEATTIAAATATATTASVHSRWSPHELAILTEHGQRYGPTEWGSLFRSGTLPGRSPIAIQEQGDRLFAPGSSRGDGETSTPRTTTVAAAAVAVAARKKKRVCRFPGCTQIIKSQGRCRRHGAKVKRCKVEGCDKEAQYTHQRMCKRHWRELTCKGNMKRNNSRVSDGVTTGVTKQNTAWIDPKNRTEPSNPTRTPPDPIPSNSTATMTTAITDDSSQVSRRTSRITITTVPIKEGEQDDADDYQQLQQGNQRTHDDEECDNTENRLDRDTKGFWSRATNVKVENHDDKEEERLWTTFFQEEGDVDDDDNDADDDTRRDEHPEDNTVTDATRNTAIAVMPTTFFHQEAITGGGEEIVF